MAQRCEDVSAWSRAFMSAAGPHPTTRLVLAGHRQFMKRDGSGCWAGVRRLAIVTGLDKSTVAKHRALALGAGWLIVSARSPRSRFRTYLSAVPDAVPIPQTHRTRNSASAGGLSEQTGQSSPPRLSGFSVSTVRPERTHCPTPPDKTLQLTNKRTLAQRDGHPSMTGATPPIRRVDHRLQPNYCGAGWRPTARRRDLGAVTNSSLTSLRPNFVSRATKTSFEKNRLNRKEILLSKAT